VADQQDVFAFGERLKPAVPLRNRRLVQELLCCLQLHVSSQSHRPQHDFRSLVCADQGTGVGSAELYTGVRQKLRHGRALLAPVRREWPRRVVFAIQRFGMSQKVKSHSRLAGEFAPVAVATYNRRALNTTKAKRVAVAAILAGAIGIGFAPVLVRLSEVGPSATAFFRLLFALPFLWIWLSTQPRGPETRPSTAKDFLWLTVAGLFFTGDLALWHWSLQFTSVANSTLLTNFAPLFVTIGACFFLREKITRTFVAGMGIALAGAILLVIRCERLFNPALGGTGTDNRPLGFGIEAVSLGFVPSNGEEAA